ncbi:MAG TPA: alpha/beta hydrolase [Ohtaekwangia sp.]|nr:alpha/beta hydrolase [Ohtaekwangia sp.]
MKIYYLVIVLFSCLSAIAQPVVSPSDGPKKSVILNTGIVMKYVDTGNADGIPVLLLHGYTDTSRSFQLIIEELVRINSNFRVIAPDLRGHGQTSMPDAGLCRDNPEECFSPDQFAADVIDLMNQLHLRKVYLVGHSMGSVIAQTLALQHPSRINSMVLIGTFVNGKEVDAIHEFLIAEMIEGKWKPILEQRQPGFQWPRDAWSLTPRDLEAATGDFLKDNWVVEDAAAPSFLESVYQETMDIPLGTWIGVIRALEKIDNRAILKRLEVPTLIIRAEKDTFIMASDHEAVRSAFIAAAENRNTPIEFRTYHKPTLSYAGVPCNPGHNLHWGVAASVAEDINRFFNNDLVRR